MINDPQKKIRQSAVAAIFRFNPVLPLSQQFFSFLQNKCHKPYQTDKPEANISPYSQLEQILNHPELKDLQKGILQLLYIQRADNPNDVNSGQLAFPGGHLENHENDLQGVLREVHEEIGLNIKDDIKSVYFGKLPQNFFVRRTRNGDKLFATVHFFLLIQSNSYKLTL